MNPSRRRKSRKMAVDSSSARTAPTTDGLVILSMVNVQPRAAATLPMARTRVEHRGQLELYPFLQMPTEPALSTQTRTGRKRQYCRPALMQISGPTSRQLAVEPLAILGSHSEVNAAAPWNKEPKWAANAADAMSREEGGPARGIRMELKRPGREPVQCRDGGHTFSGFYEEPPEMKLLLHGCGHVHPSEPVVEAH